MSEKNSKKGLNRRDFIKGAAVGAGTIALSGFGLKEAKASSQRVTKPRVSRWDYEADVVVVGAGFAAQAAAIEAHDAGVDVLMLEKAPEKYQGGNSRVCGQGFLSPSPAIWTAYYSYLKAATAGLGFPVNPDETFSDETLRFYTEESAKNKAWFEGMGAYVMDSAEAFGGMLNGHGGWIPFYPHFPGADAIASEPGFYRVGGEYSGDGSNWYFLEDQIIERGIRKMCETPVKGLVQDVDTKEILGVVAESLWDKYPREIYIKAKKAVCVCSGGWEYNQQMVRDFQGIACNYSIGSPYNTGESIKMCWEAGADIRNMSAIAAPAGFCAGIKPGYQATIGIADPTKGGYIRVGANNKRWRDEHRFDIYGGIGREYDYRKEHAGKEGTSTGTGQIIENGVFVRDKYPMPMHMIFDEEARLSGPVFGGWGGWARQVEGFAPSADNSVELENGWMIKADSIKELATKIGRDPDELEATVNRWNEFCAAGEDLDHGRTTNLTPIEKGSFYAVQNFPSCLNTQGGMLRNIKSQVLDTRGQVIPRLLAAGENGDIWTLVYQCMSNVGGGCYAYGRIAGQNAAAAKSWD